MGDRGIAISVALALAVCWGVTSLDVGGGSCNVHPSFHEYAKVSSEIYLECARRIEAKEIKSDADMNFYLHEAGNKAIADKFFWRTERMAEAENKSEGKWDIENRAEACRDIARKQTGE